MKVDLHRSCSRGFTLVEMLVVISIIATLAALTMGGYTYAMRGSREKTTRGTFEAISGALDLYNEEHGEFPEPAESGQMLEFVPGKIYDMSGASCLYQALSGDGYDKIKGVSGNAGGEGAKGTSDGKVEGDAEVKNIMLREMPQTMFTKKNNVYIIVDGFGRPFQYIKAAPLAAANDEANQPTTINSTYDLWSYSFDETNTTKKSIDTLQTPKIAIKWIKNW